MNAAKGERLLHIDDTSMTVCLTLGALAELEHIFGCATLAELQTRLQRLSACEMKRVLAVLISGDVTEALLDRVNPVDAAKAIAEAFHAALG